MHRFWALMFLAPAVWGQDVNLYSIEKEQALGRHLASEYLRSATVIDKPAVRAYVTSLGKRIAGQTQGPAFSYTFETVEQDQLFLHEPVVGFPGGAVFIPSGLILAVTREDELAGMLAHAIAHIAARHGSKHTATGQIVNQASIPLIYLGGWQGVERPFGLCQTAA